MAKITLTTVTNGQDISNINANFSALATALNSNVLYRVNIGSEPNTPAQDLDFNGFKIYNLSDLLVNGISVLTLTQTAADATGTATAAALAAQASATAAAASATSASTIVAGALQKSANLFDLQSIPNAKINLGLDQVSNTSDANKPISTAQAAALALKANLVSPALTGSPTTSLVAAGDNSTKIAPTAFVFSAFGAPPVGIGSFTPTSVAATTITATGLITPNTAFGIKGTVVGDNANTGSVGEYLSSLNSTPITLTTSTTTNVGQLNTLPAGDWDVWGSVLYLPNSGTTISSAYAGITVTSGTLGAVGDYVQVGAAATSFGLAVATPVARISISVPTLIYIAANVIHNGTVTATSIIKARRVR